MPTATQELRQHRADTAALADAEDALTIAIAPEGLTPPDGDDDPFGEPSAPATPWTLDTPGKADWALRQIARQAQLLQSYEETAQEEKVRWDAWVQTKRQDFEERIAWLKGHLEHYARNHCQATGEKHLDLPAGRLQLKARPVAVVWPEKEEDAAKLLEWAANNGLASLSLSPTTDPGAVAALRPVAAAHGIRTTTAPSKSEIKKACATQGQQLVHKATGEIVPGVTVDDSRELEFSFKLSE